MRTVLAGFFVVALAGCPEGLFDASGVCIKAENTLCYKHLSNSNVTRRQCDEEGSLFVEDSTCAEAGYTESCREVDEMQIFGLDTEACAAFVDDGEGTATPES